MTFYSRANPPASKTIDLFNQIHHEDCDKSYGFVRKRTTKTILNCISASYTVSMLDPITLKTPDRPFRPSNTIFVI